MDYTFVYRILISDLITCSGIHIHSSSFYNNSTLNGMYLHLHTKYKNSLHKVLLRYFSSTTAIP